MKFTLSWLKDHLDTTADIKIIVNTLTNIGLEVEFVEDNSEKFKYFTVAKVVSATKHPNADRLKVCEVQTNNGNFQVVCFWMFLYALLVDRSGFLFVRRQA